MTNEKLIKTLNRVCVQHYGDGCSLNCPLLSSCILRSFRTQGVVKLFDDIIARFYTRYFNMGVRTPL